MNTKEEILEVARVIRECFHLRGHFWRMKTNDGQYVDSHEDLNDALFELDELLDVLVDEAAT